MATSLRTVRSPAAAGRFYPADAATLRGSVRELLTSARRTHRPDSRPVRALIVPHAALPYSGAVAAAAFIGLEPWRAHIRRVVLLGPAHFTGESGVLASALDHLTPLGVVPVDKPALEAITIPGFRVSEAAHECEHALEVQLPFLQLLLEDFTIVPLLAGSAALAAATATLARLCDAHTLILISSDLSHYHAAPEARRRDRATAAAVLRLHAERLDGHAACGRTPIAALLALARRRLLRPRLEALRTSADRDGRPDRVVGYGAFTFFETRPVALARPAATGGIP